jgi:pilus assembly protein CpaE
VSAGDGEPRGLLARLSGERGQASVEFAGLLPLLFVILLLLWQVALTGYTFMLAGHSAREGARELATNNSDLPNKNPPYAKTAVADLPKAWRKGAKVDKPDEVTVRVKLNVPIVVPMMKSPWKVSSEAGTSVEDEPLPPSQSKAGI